MAGLSSPFFNMPLQAPVPPSGCSPAGPPAAAYRGERGVEPGCSFFQEHVRSRLHEAQQINVQYVKLNQMKCMGKRNCPPHTQNGQPAPSGI